MAARVQINAEMVLWARERARLEYEDFSADIRERIPEWESGDSLPTLKQAKKFAGRTLCPFGYLFLDSPPPTVKPIPDFRSIGGNIVSKYSVELETTILEIQERQEWMREYLEAEEVEPLDFVGSLKSESDPERVAVRARSLLNLSPGWQTNMNSASEAVTFLAGRMEKIGVLVMRNSVVRSNNTFPLDVAEFRGFALSDKFAPIIFLNNRDYNTAKQFTLAHEFAHILLGSDGVSGEVSQASVDIERFCNQVAAHIIAPRHYLKRRLGGRAAPASILRLAKELHMGGMPLAIQCKSVGLIDEDVSRITIAKWNSIKKKKAKSGPVPFPKLVRSRLGATFSNAVVSASHSGALLARDAFRLTGTSGNSFAGFAEYVRAS